MELTNMWYVAGWEHDFPAGELVARTILNQRLVLYRTQDGALAALEDRCRHRFAPLSVGRLEGDDVRCMYHGFKYAPSGRCVEIPGQDTVPDAACVRAFPVVERHSWAWVWMGEPARADESLIPEAVGLDHPDWLLRPGSLSFEAPARLAHDNLLDFSHLTYVHARSFGAGKEFATAPARVTQLPNGVHVERWVEDRPQGPVTTVSYEGRVDARTDYKFVVPGVILLHSSVFPGGAAAALDRGTPDYANALYENFSCQVVTPETDDTSRHYFSWGPRRGLDAAAEKADALIALAYEAFEEDKFIIEAQHRSMKAAPHPAPLPSSHDKAVLMYNKLVASLAEAETRAGAA